MSDLVQIDGLAPLTTCARKPSKVMLLFPPEWVPTAPYLALPSLTAILRQAGHTVIQRDVNIEMYDHFFSLEFLIWVKGRLGMMVASESGGRAIYDIQAPGISIYNASIHRLTRLVTVAPWW